MAKILACLNNSKLRRSERSTDSERDAWEFEGNVARRIFTINYAEGGKRKTTSSEQLQPSAALQRASAARFPLKAGASRGRHLSGHAASAVGVRPARTRHSHGRSHHGAAGRPPAPLPLPRTHDAAG